MTTLNIALPFDLVDSIITSNPEIIFTIYNRIIDDCNDKCNSKKRKRNTHSYFQNLINNLIQNKNIYLNKSHYFKYLNNIDISVNIYVLLAKYINKQDGALDTQKKNNNNNKNNNKNNYNLLGNIEKLNLEYPDFNKLLEIYKLKDASELPDFIKIFLLISNGFELDRKKHVSYILHIILAYYNNKIEDVETYLHYQNITEEYKYFLQPEYKFIPVCTFYLGMGFYFIVGYDMILDKLIGFMDGGGCAQECEYNRMLIQNYMKLNKKCRLEKYNKNCSSNSNKKTYKQSYLENITKYLELIDIDIRNLPNQFNYFNEMKLNILDN